MRKTTLLFAFFALLAFSGFAQTYTVTISGQVTDLSNQPVANHPVTINFDSTGGFTFYTNLLTNANGVYSQTIQVPTNTASSSISVYTADCNQQTIWQGLNYVPGPSTFSNVDFQICNVNSVCNASFTSANTTANPATWNFTDQSTSSSSVTGWFWDFGDGSSSTSQNPTHTYAIQGIYPVCLTITSATNCTNTYCDSVFFSNSSTCSVGLSPTVSGNNASFLASPSGAGTPVSYSWIFGDGNVASSTTPNITHPYASAGTYNACVTVLFSDSCSITNCALVTIAPCQASFFTYPDTTGQFSILGINTSTGSGLAYSWNFGDGNTSTLAYPVHQYAGAGTYTICLTVTSNVQNCNSTYCDSITVTNKTNAAFTFAVINPATGISETELDASSIQMYPNPSTDAVNIRLETTSTVPVSIQLMDIQGRTVRQINADDLGMGEHDFRIETNDLPSGLYLTRFQIGEQTVTKKLIVN